jgi:4-alpha-glucanotransferase
VLHIAFDGNPDNPFLPHHSGPDAVVYTGTHDNDTTRGWYESLPEQQRQAVWSYVGRPPGAGDEVAWELLRLAWSSPAGLAMAPLQDVLNLGSEARMNRPGSANGNWRWRVADTMLSGPVFDRLRSITVLSGRVPAPIVTPASAGP